jgi:hypothetical protein
MRNATLSYDYNSMPFGFDNGSRAPFFNYIMIYQMARHEYVSYKLHNPIITAWNHNKVDYAQNTVHDNTMTLQYEAVSYGNGNVSQGDPEGFAIEHYDQSLSPLQPGANAGSLSNTSPTFTNQSETGLGTIGTIISSVAGYQNKK